MRKIAFASVISAALLLSACNKKPDTPASTVQAPTLAEVRASIVAGNYGDAAQKAQSYISGHANDPDGYFEDARAEALAGNQGRAFDALEKAVNNGLANPAQALADPSFDTIRDSDRFNTLSARAAPASQGGAVSKVEAGSGADHVEISGKGAGTHIRAGDVKLDTNF